MRVFLISVVAVVVLALGAFLSLNALQKPSGAAYTTDGARIDPGWSFRQVFSRAKVAPKTVAMAMPTSEGLSNEGCDVSSAWALILTDFSGSPTADSICDH